MPMMSIMAISTTAVGHPEERGAAGTEGAGTI